MILNIPFKLLNVENKVQLSISEGTKATQRIVRESAAEHLKDSNGN